MYFVTLYLVTQPNPLVQCNVICFHDNRLQLEILRHSTIVKIEFDADGCWHPLLDGIVIYFYCNDQYIGIKVTRKEWYQ